MVILNLWSLAEDFREKNQEILLKPNKPIFNPMFHFSTPWKRQKTVGFLKFSVGIVLYPLQFYF